MRKETQKTTAVSEILGDFAFYGHTESPLTVLQIEACLALKISRSDIYDIGCDCASGYRFREALDAHFVAVESGVAS